MADAPTPDPLAGFLQAVIDSAYRPRSHRPEPEPEPEPENMPAGDRRREHLRRMLREALAPAKPEDTWRQRFPGRKALTNELFSRTENEERP